MSNYVNKLDNSVEMDKFLEIQKLPTLTQKEIINKSGPITREWVSDQKPLRKTQTQVSSLLNSTEHFKNTTTSQTLPIIKKYTEYFKENIPSTIASQKEMVKEVQSLYCKYYKT